MPKRPEQYQQDDKINKAFAFFRGMEQKNTSITLQSIVDATGYTPGVVKAYISKKWHWFLIRQNSVSKQEDSYLVMGFLNISYTDFHKMHRQVATPHNNEALAHQEATLNKAEAIVLLFILLIIMELHFRLKQPHFRIWNCFYFLYSMTLLTANQTRYPHLIR